MNPAPPMSALRASRWGQPVFAGLLALCLGLVALRLAGQPIADPTLCAALGALLLAILLGVRFASLGCFGRPIVAGQSDKPLVALTFDDGPHPEHTPLVLQALAGTAHHATFFVIGERAQRHPALVAEILRRGHALGNHTWRHDPWTATLPVSRLRPALDATNLELQRAGVVQPRWFRAPVGLVSPPVTGAAKLAGLEVVHWTATARDGVPWADPDKGLRRLVASLRNGAILVLHDGVQTPAGRRPAGLAMLPRLLAELDARGLRSVTLDELLQAR